MCENPFLYKVREGWGGKGCYYEFISSFIVFARLSQVCCDLFLTEVLWGAVRLVNPFASGLLPRLNQVHKWLNFSLC